MSHRVSFGVCCTQGDYKKKERSKHELLPAVSLGLKYIAILAGGSRPRPRNQLCPPSPPGYREFLCPLLVSLKKDNKLSARAHCTHVRALCLDASICSCVISNVCVCVSLSFRRRASLFCGSYIDVTPACQEALAFVFLSVKSWWHPLKCRLASLMFIQD